MKKGYKDRDIEEEIKKKIEGLNRTRSNRINSSERLYSYSSRWEFVFFLMNVAAVIFLVISLLNIETKYGLVISSCFSLYTVILQYYYNALNYNERALKFHYQQLEIEGYIFKLKSLLRKRSDEQYLESQFDAIVEKYLTNLEGTNNHSFLDDELRKKQEEKAESGLTKIKDFSVDNVLFYFNSIIFILFIIGYVYFVFV